MSNKSSWGILLFMLSLVLLAVGFWYFGLRSQQPNVNFVTKFFFYTGIAGGVLVPMLGYLSYPRVHNLKVFLAGYLTGLGVLAFFLLGPMGFFSSSVLSNFIPGLYLLMIGAIFLSTILPTFLKYRYAKYITIAILLIEAFFIYILRTSIVPFASLSSFRHFNIFQWTTLIPVIVLLFTLLLSIFVLKLKFYLGGVLGGMILLLCGGWYLGPINPNPLIFDSYIFATIPLFLGFGTLIHWIARIEHRAFYDPLLRVYNRSYCEKVLCEQVRINTSPPFGIAIVDIDRFKRINDTYGHRAGDEVLIQIARILTNQLVPEGIVCRYGGDEFIVFFPQKDREKVKVIMDRFHKLVKNAKIRSGKRKIKVTLSIGVSYRKTVSQDLSEVLKVADRALYFAKKHGRNQVRSSKVTTS